MLDLVVLSTFTSDPQVRAVFANWRRSPVCGRSCCIELNCI